MPSAEWVSACFCLTLSPSCSAASVRNSPIRVGWFFKLSEGISTTGRMEELCLLKPFFETLSQCSSEKTESELASMQSSESWLSLAAMGCDMCQWASSGEPVLDLCDMFSTKRTPFSVRSWESDNFLLKKRRGMGEREDWLNCGKQESEATLCEKGGWIVELGSVFLFIAASVGGLGEFLWQLDSVELSEKKQIAAHTPTFAYQNI